MTTAAEIREWFDNGVESKDAYMIVVCDTYDWDDYPLYVKPGDDFWKAYDSHNGPNMTKIMEVYDLSRPWPTKAGRVFDMPARPSTTSGVEK